MANMSRVVRKGVVRAGSALMVAMKGLDGFAADEVDEVVGGGVVADRDHLEGVFGEGVLGAGGVVLHDAAGERLPVVADGEFLVPGCLATLDLLGEGAEDVELEGGADGEACVGVEGVNGGECAVGIQAGGVEVGRAREGGEFLVEGVPCRCAAGAGAGDDLGR
jgi:hypothetical protein